jgi:hypothetical protein
VMLSALRAGCPLPPGRFLLFTSVRGRVDPRAIVRLEGLGQLKNPVTSGIEPATFRLVAQCLTMGCILNEIQGLCSVPSQVICNDRYVSVKNEVCKIPRNAYMKYLRVHICQPSTKLIQLRWRPKSISNM